MGCEVDLVEHTFGFENFREGSDLLVVLDVNDEARDESTQDLGDDVSRRLQWWEASEQDGRDGDTGTEVSPRHRSADGNGEDDSYRIGKTNTK